MDSCDDLDLYAALAQRGAIEPRLGRAMISLIEPKLGAEREYNRWYEDDHMVVSAMACPWIFAGRRWVATRDLRALRYPERSTVMDPIDLGCYLATYWILEQRYEQFLSWVRSLVEQRLQPASRMPRLRRHVFTNEQKLLASVYRDAAGPRDIHALDYPYKGLVMQVIEAREPGQRQELCRWLGQNLLPGQLLGGPAAMCLIFAATPPHAPRPEIDWYDRRLTLLWFLEVDPRLCWTELFLELGALVDAHAAGSVQLVAPFVPVLPGTDVYVDQLR